MICVYHSDLFETEMSDKRLTYDDPKLYSENVRKHAIKFGVLSEVTDYSEVFRYLFHQPFIMNQERAVKSSDASFRGSFSIDPFLWNNIRKRLNNDVFVDNLFDHDDLPGSGM